MRADVRKRRDEVLQQQQLGLEEESLSYGAADDVADGGRSAWINAGSKNKKNKKGREKKTKENKDLFHENGELNIEKIIEVAKVRGAAILQAEEFELAADNLPCDAFDVSADGTKLYMDEDHKYWCQNPYCKPDGTLKPLVFPKDYWQKD